MKKNFSVNIGGRIFNIDDDAYDRLNVYLNSLSNYFASDPGREEILADIEGRIAELLEQKKSQGIVIITLDHILEVIRNMGEPDQLSGNAPDESTPGSAAKTAGKLYRDPDNRMIGGVAAGIAAWFGIDPLWIRLLFAISVFAYFIGGVVYLILWLILPVAKTASEKLDMQRRIINIGTLRNEVASAGSGIKKTGNTLVNSLGKFLRFLTEIAVHLFRLLVRVLRIALGVTLILLVLSLFTGIIMAYVVRESFHMGIYHLDTTNLVSAFGWLLPGASVSWLAYLSIVLIITALAGFLIYFGLKLMLKWPPMRWQVLSVLGLILLAGALLGGGATYQYSRSTLERASSSNVVASPQKEKTLRIVLASDDPNQYWKPLDGKDIMMTTQRVLGNVKLSIRPAPGDSLIITSIRQASSYTESLASEYLTAIDHKFVIQDTLITLDPYFSFPKSEGMHHQSLEMIIGVPLWTVVKFNNDITWKINYREYLERTDEWGEYIMTSAGLQAKNPPKPEVEE